MNRHRHRRTKIVATLGPATDTPEAIRELVDAGMDCARINASHGNHEEHRRLIGLVREAAEAAERPVGVLYDLQGPKIRLGTFSGDRMVQAGDEIVLTIDPEPTGQEIPVDHQGLPGDVEIGDPLLIDDGTISSVVMDKGETSVTCRVLNDGILFPRKGINLPASNVSTPSLTEKDRIDAAFAVQEEVDVLALSFVRQPEDVQELVRYLKDDLDATTPVIAKIEKPQALQNLESVLEASWGVMVARGDLGVELPPERVPMTQKHVIQTARQMARPVITATQMLESMTRNPRPTRAEASDVANAVLDGTDAVMLSQETSVGRYARESVEMMDRLIRATDDPGGRPQGRRREREIDSPWIAVADAGAQVARHLRARALAAFTQSGLSAILASKRRPDVPILAFASRRRLVNRLALVWGVEPHFLPEVETTDELIASLDRRLLERKLALEGDKLVLLMGAHAGGKGPTNLMMVHVVGSWVTGPAG